MEYIEHINGFPIRLKEPFDLSFINDMGTLFWVLDTQGSGNLCFGIEKARKKYFAKFAGARMINDHDLSPEDAIARLKAAVPKYIDLAHPLLIHFVEAFEIGEGFIVLFDWEDGKSIGDQDPVLHEKFISLPVNNRMNVFEEILLFHAHVAQCGYVAIDFNDNSTLYNFDTGKVKICDIDFYAKQSYMNGMGRIFGINPLMSPEEYRCAGLLDEITNVYTMGAASFLFLTQGDRSLEKWPLNIDLYKVARKAISDTRKHRQQSINQFIEEWNRYK